MQRWSVQLHPAQDRISPCLPRNLGRSRHSYRGKQSESQNVVLLNKFTKRINSYELQCGEKSLISSVETVWCVEWVGRRLST